MQGREVHEDANYIFECGHCLSARMSMQSEAKNQR